MLECRDGGGRYLCVAVSCHQSAQCHARQYQINLTDSVRWNLSDFVSSVIFSPQQHLQCL